jgi:tetratricopeptide (TPR) repeat protein
MIAPLLLLVLAGEGQVDPCSEVAPPSARADDRAEAPVYRAVGDDERAAGHVEAARSAYREALRRDPDDARARERLSELCRMRDADRLAHPQPPPVSAPDHFEDGLARMKRGDRPGAIAAFEAARALGADPGAALLEGICEYEEGRDRKAQALLEQARNDPKLAGTALFFLGLIALHDSQEHLAASLLDDAAVNNPRLAATAAGLARGARRDGRVVASLLAEAGYDSNVSLAPDGPEARAGAGDGYATTVAGLLLRPLGSPGPYARVTGQYRKQFEIVSFDVGDASGALGFQLGRGRRYAAGEYAYDFLSLGGSPYLSAHRLFANARLSGERLAVGGAYAARLESFLTDATAPYSGLRQDADLEVDLLLSAAASIGVGYHLGADGTERKELSYVEQGPAALLRLGAGREVRLLADARVTFRRYDAVDPDLGVERADRYFDGAVAWELDASDHWTVRVTTTARRALSNVPDLQYTKLTAALGLVYTAGLR